MRTLRKPGRWIAAVTLSLNLPFSAFTQHGVIPEFAALAPQAGATALPPMFRGRLTSPSVARGPDNAYYLTGTLALSNKLDTSKSITIWRSPDLKAWVEIRTLEPGNGTWTSPEIHFLKNAFFLAAERKGGGTALIKLDSVDLARSGFRKVMISETGVTPSIFLDDDGTFYWVEGAGLIARMKEDPMQGLATDPIAIPVSIAGPPIQQKDAAVRQLRGATLAKVRGKYHLFVTGRVKRQGLGRTGAPEGVDDVLVAASEHPDCDFSAFYVAFPYAGETSLFRDAAGVLMATWSGTEPGGALRGLPAAFKVEEAEAKDPQWPIGFAAKEAPARFPFNFLLRPDRSFVYEDGVGFLKPIPLDRVPGQRADHPWIRDTFIMLAPDGFYYLTGTAGNMDGIHLWRSKNLKQFDYYKKAWAPAEDSNAWYNDAPKRLFWAPELHYIKGTYWLTFCLSAGTRGKNSFLKSTSGKPEGPYVPALAPNSGVDQDIDSSLFQDTDGSVYYVWQDGKIRKLNAGMSDFEGQPLKLVPSDGQRVGYEGATLVKIGKWYVLTCAEWNGGANRSDGTYDMMYSCSTNLLGPYTPRRAAVPHAGHGALFKDGSGDWNASMFGNDRTAPFRAMPGCIKVETTDTGADLLIRPRRMSKD